MNRAIERELADKRLELEAQLDTVADKLLDGNRAIKKSERVNPFTGAQLIRLALLITEYNTLQALQAEIDS